MNYSAKIGIAASINSFSQNDLNLDVESDTDSMKELQDSLGEFGVGRVKKPALKMILPDGTKFNSKLDLVELDQEHFDELNDYQEKQIKEIRVEYNNSNLQDEIELNNMRDRIETLKLHLKSSEVNFFLNFNIAINKHFKLNLDG
jgi:hypothetical protein